MRKIYNKDVLRRSLLLIAGMCLMVFVAACAPIQDTAAQDTAIQDTATQDTATDDSATQETETDDSTTEVTLLADAFAGEVNEELFIGVLVAEDQSVPDRKALIAYLCDGADISIWLFGETTSETTGEPVVLEAGDARVALTIGEDSVTGEVEQGGAAPQAFIAEFATEDAGLFRAVETVDGQDYVGGWVVLNDGRQRGALTLRGGVVDNPTLDLDTRVAETVIGRTGTNCFRNPFTGERICRYLN